VFFGSLLPLCWYAFAQARRRWAGAGISLLGFFTISSTAIMSVGVSLMLMAVVLLQRLTKIRLWPTALALSVLAAIFIELFSSGGLISFLIRYGTLDAASGYYRRAIWRYAGAEATNHPWFGIGLRDWIRPAWMYTSSVDSQWLLPAMRFGMPVAVGTFLLMIGGALVAVRNAKGRLAADRQLSSGIAIALFSMAFAGFSVFFWEGIFCWILLLSGAAVSLAHGPGPAPVRSVKRGPRRSMTVLPGGEHNIREGSAQRST
jgi:hypothetical protein